MQRCPRCKKQNLLTAVFCHYCGQRLDLDNIQPKHFMHWPAEIHLRFLGLILLLAVVVCVIPSTRDEILQRYKNSAIHKKISSLVSEAKKRPKPSPYKKALYPSQGNMSPLPIIVFIPYAVPAPQPHSITRLTILIQMMIG